MEALVLLFLRLSFDLIKVANITKRGKYMSKLFFGKMNINEDIYDVYNKKVDINKLLTKIYVDFNAKTIIYDALGGRYKFFDVDKFEDNSVIYGRLGYIKKGVHSTYDPDKDTAIDIEDKNKIEYITFYFDVFNEILSYTVNPILTKKKVLEIFEELIKKSTGVGVKFILETDINELNKELKKFDVLRRVSLKLVPPNGDKDQFSKLFSLSAEKVATGGATTIKQEYSNRSKVGLNKDSELIKDAADGIALGYAEGKFYRKDSHGEEIEFLTEKDAPYTKIIPNEQNKNKLVIAEKGRAGVVDLLAYKAKIREKNKNGETK